MPEIKPDVLYLMLLGHLVAFIIISSSTFRERIEQIRASLVKPAGWQDSNDDSVAKRATEAPTESVARANRKAHLPPINRMCLSSSYYPHPETPKSTSSKDSLLSSSSSRIPGSQSSDSGVTTASVNSWHGLTAHHSLPGLYYQDKEGDVCREQEAAAHH
ncbi:hypothetical protein LZ554_000348 [Drepanopeziza brunnea f. sp. 'monogermtubi']|nr:hypothetical protein LZ554_000348 [Drepanopeziza brunnea f. sp. 'monogermtubi']